jgi:hypothetical protein
VEEPKSGAAERLAVGRFQTRCSHQPMPISSTREAWPGLLSFRRHALQRLPDLLPPRGGAVSLARRFNSCRYLNFCAKRLFTFSACGAGDRVKPGVERDSAEPQVWRASYQQAREAGDSDWSNLNDDDGANDKKLPPAFAGLMGLVGP